VQAAPAKPASHVQAAVPEASEHAPRPHRIAAVAHSGAHVPSWSLSWYPAAQTPQSAPAPPASHTHAAVPVESEHAPWPLHDNAAVVQSGRHVPSESRSWYPAAHAVQSAPAWPVSQTHAADPVASEHVPWPPHESPAIGHPRAHVPSPSLSWYPAAHKAQSAPA